MKPLSTFTFACLFLGACSGGDDPAARPTAVSDDALVPGEADEARGVLVSEDGYRLTPLATDLDIPWDMLFLPNGDMLVTERGGQIRVIQDGSLLPNPVSGTPEALVEGQGGYFAMALDPGFAENRMLYLAYAKGTSGANTTTVVSGILSDDNTSLTEVQEIFAGAVRQTSYHFGGRLAFIDDGTLIITMGDGFRYMDDAQNPMNYHGTIARINTDGSIPQDNPFADGAEGAPAVWSYGHRNTQGLLWDAGRGMLWTHEHGPKGGDELNVIEAGSNYGWPTITYGVNYDGTIITDKTEAPGMEQPVAKWVPSIAPSGMTLVKSEAWSGWSDDLIIAAMNGPEGQKLVHVDLDEGGNVLELEDFLADLEIPFRDVEFGPDGTLYAATADHEGIIYAIERIED